MQKGHPSHRVIDGHIDIIYEMMRHHLHVPFHQLSDAPVTSKKLAAANVRVLVTALYCPDSQNGPQTAAACLQELFQYADSYLSGLNHIKTSKELEACFTADDLSMPGTVLLLENADALLDLDLSVLKSRALKVVGLTHAGKNRIGDGNGVSSPGGLTKEGKQLLTRLEREGFAIDVAHLSDPCFSDVLDGFTGPLISSHTGFRFFCRKPRNLDEHQLRALMERKGIVGIAVNPEMLSDNDQASVQDVFRHIDWVVQSYGPDHVALGSDFCGFDVTCEGMEDISKFADLTRILDEHGYPESAIRSIMGENWYRFYNSHLGS
jgi:membrane dipeptidase